VLLGVGDESGAPALNTDGSGELLFLVDLDLERGSTTGAPALDDTMDGIAARFQRAEVGLDVRVLGTLPPLAARVDGHF
jgi:hypothetical protein